jgi:hypothetical protein
LLEYGTRMNADSTDHEDTGRGSNGHENTERGSNGSREYGTRITRIPRIKRDRTRITRILDTETDAVQLWGR